MMETIVRPNRFSGIGATIGRFFGVEPKLEDESLEEKINNALAHEWEKITPTREDNESLQRITKDNNPIHISSDAAKKLGLKDTPIMGIHTAGYAEQFMEKVIDNMRSYWGADMKMTGLYTGFKGFVYPGDKILWQVTGYASSGEVIKLKTEGRVGENVVTDVEAELGKEYKRMPQIAGPISFRRYSIEEAHIAQFCKCVGVKYEKKIPKMLVSSFVPSTLLAIAEEKGMKIDGINLSMSYDFLGDAEPGSVQVDIFPSRRARPRKMEDGGQAYIYKFKTVCSQDTKPLAYGEMVCLSRSELNFSLTA